MANNTLMVVGASIGIGFMSIALVYLLVSFAQNSLRKYQNSQAHTFAKDTFERWVEETEAKIKRTQGFKLKGWIYAILILASSAVAGLLALILFGNMIAAGIFAVTVGLAVDSIQLKQSIQTQEKMTQQLAPAIRFFVSEFSFTPSVERAIGAVAKDLDDPLGKVFRNAHRKLRLGVAMDKVMSDMAAEMNFHFGFIFVNIIMQAKNDTSIIPLFNKLVERISRHEVLMNENKARISWDKSLSMIMTTTPVIAYFVVRSVIPEAQEYLVQTLAGKVTICLIFAAILLWVILNRISAKVGI